MFTVLGTLATCRVRGCRVNTDVCDHPSTRHSPAAPAFCAAAVRRWKDRGMDATLNDLRAQVAANCCGIALLKGIVWRHSAGALARRMVSVRECAAYAVREWVLRTMDARGMGDEGVVTSHAGPDISVVSAACAQPRVVDHVQLHVASTHRGSGTPVLTIAMANGRLRACGPDNDTPPSSTVHHV